MYYVKGEIHMARPSFNATIISLLSKIFELDGGWLDYVLCVMEIVRDSVENYCDYEANAAVRTFFW